MPSSCGSPSRDPVRFERSAAPVRRETVDLQGHPLFRPQEVDNEAADAGVRLRRGQARCPKERGHALLRLPAVSHPRSLDLDEGTKPANASHPGRATQQLVELRHPHEPPEAHLIESLLELGIRGACGEVEERARRARHRDRVEQPAVPAMERAHGANVDAGPRGDRTTGDDELHGRRRIRVREGPVEVRRGAPARRRPRAVGQHGRHRLGLRVRGGSSHPVDAAVG